AHASHDKWGVESNDAGTHSREYRYDAARERDKGAVDAQCGALLIRPDAFTDKGAHIGNREPLRDRYKGSYQVKPYNTWQKRKYGDRHGEDYECHVEDAPLVCAFGDKGQDKELGNDDKASDHGGVGAEISCGETEALHHVDAAEGCEKCEARHVEKAREV